MVNHETQIRFQGNPDQLLKRGFKEININCNDEQRNGFMTYLMELKRWNKRYNLTGLKTDEEIIIKHFLDSLLYLKAIPPGGISIADVGSGAGFPGIPIKLIRPEVQLTLIESRRKKAAFLRQLIRLLQLNDTLVYQMRLEGLGDKEKGRYDIIVSRATFKIDEFVKKACPYVKKGGLLILSKGRGLYKEIKKAPDVKPLIKEIINIRLPFIDAVRNLVIIDCSRKGNDQGNCKINLQIY